jgi:phage-related minor tail protein
MTAPTEQIFDLTRRGQEAVATAVRTWADAVQSATGSFAVGGPDKLPDVRAFVDSSVDQAFDAAEKVLAAQRQLAHTVLAASAQATEAVTEQAVRTARKVSAQTVEAAENVAEATEASTEAAKPARAPRPKS